MSPGDLAAEIRATPFFWRVRLSRRLHRHAAMDKRVHNVERQLAALMRFIELEAEAAKREREDRERKEAGAAYVAAAAVAARRREMHVVSAGGSQ